MKDVLIRQVFHIQLIKTSHFLILFLHDLFSRHLIGEMIILENGVVGDQFSKVSVSGELVLVSPDDCGELFLVKIKLGSLFLEADIDS